MIVLTCISQICIWILIEKILKKAIKLINSRNEIRGYDKKMKLEKKTLI